MSDRTYDEVYIGIGDLYDPGEDERCDEED